MIVHSSPRFRPVVGRLHGRGIHWFCTAYRRVVDERAPSFSEFIATKDGDVIDVTNQSAVGKPTKWHWERVTG